MKICIFCDSLCVFFIRFYLFYYAHFGRKRAEKNLQAGFKPAGCPVD